MKFLIIVLILLECFNLVLLKNELLYRYLERKIVDFENLYFSERPLVAASCY